MIRSTKRQRDELLNCHVGVGFLVYKSKENVITETDFYLKNGHPCYFISGKPVEFKIYEWEEER